MAIHIYFKFDHLVMLALEMAGGDKIELFKFIRKTYKHIEISEFDQEHNLINLKHCFIILCDAQFFLSSTAYLLFKANSMIEYGMAFFICTSIVASTAVYLIFFYKVKNILNYIEKCEAFIQKSEYRVNLKHSLVRRSVSCVDVTGTHSTIIYKNTTEKIERLVQFFVYALVATVIIFTLPPLLYTMASYGILHSGRDSFVLFFPVWYVFAMNSSD